MSEPNVPVEEVGVPLTFDDDEPPREIDCNDEPWVDQLAEGELRAEDFQQPYPLPDEVPVFQDELPSEPEPAGPAVELLLNVEQAAALLDRLVPDGSWRSWPRPPCYPVRGKGWYATGFSARELEAWAMSSTDRA